MFILPNFLGFLAFVAFPVLAAAGLSLVEWDLIRPAQFIGFENYSALLASERFRTVIWKTIYFTLGSVPLQVALGLLMATALNQKIRGIALFRSVYFLPVISSMVAVALIWRWLFNTNFGLINLGLEMVGIPGVPWLSSTTWAMPAVIIVAVWKELGFYTVIFLAGLQGIPTELYEAARIDGATSFNVFRYVTLPLLKPTTFFVTVISLINSFQVFDAIYVMTNGGPRRSTQVLVHYIYESAFRDFLMGRAAAASWILFALVLIFTLLYTRTSQGLHSYN